MHTSYFFAAPKTRTRPGQTKGARWPEGQRRPEEQHGSRKLVDGRLGHRKGKMREGEESIKGGHEGARWQTVDLELISSWLCSKNESWRADLVLAQ